MRFPFLAALIALPLAPLACGTSENAVVSIGYRVSDVLVDQSLEAWSCLAQGRTDGPGAAAIDWTVGAAVFAIPTPNYERACGAWGEACPDPQMVMTPLDARVWEPGSAWGTSMTSLEAIAAGRGGMNVQAQGRTFPPLELHAVAPSGFRFFRFSDTLDTREPIVDRLVVAKGAKVTILPQLVSATGPLCGFAEMVVNATGPIVGWDYGRRANAPLLVTGGDPGKIEFSAGGASGTLTVDSN